MAQEQIKKAHEIKSSDYVSHSGLWFLVKEVEIQSLFTHCTTHEGGRISFMTNSNVRVK